MERQDIGELYERYGCFVYQRCLAILKSRADADDALHEVFLRVQRYRETERGASTLGWLYTIAGNVCFDLMKRQGRAPRADTTPEPEPTPAGEPTDADRRALLGTVLRRLDARTREIGMLHFLGGWTQEEVAAQTGMSRRSIGRRLEAFERTFRRLWLGATGGEGHES